MVSILSQEGELFCNIVQKQLDNSEEVEDLIQKQVLIILFWFDFI